MSIGALEGVGVSFLIPFLSTLADSSTAAAREPLALIMHFAEGHSRTGRLLIITSVILGCVLLKSSLQVVSNAFTAWTDSRIGHDIRSALSEQLQSVGYTFFLVQESARLVNIFTTESWKASETVRVVLNRIAAIATILVFGALLFLVSWRLSLMVLVGGLLARFVQKKAEVKLRELSGRTVLANQALADQMLFAILGSRLIRLFNNQRAEHIRFTGTSDDVRHALFKVESLSGLVLPLLEAMHGVLFMAVLLTAVFTGVSLPVLAAFLALMNRLQPHLRTIEQTGTAFASAAGQLGEVEWLLNSAGKPAAPTGDLAFRGLRDEIEFDNVTFEYREDGGEPALANASFVLRRGRSTALIGGSGAGKSTVLNLLCRLLEPVSGSIKVDGELLSRIKVSDWLNAIAVAGQDVELIDGTIAENISYSRPGMDRAKIERAARAARADFIDGLPQGLESLVGNRGLSLSGGQRQRIGIARALAREPEILILDEATNAVDHETENGIIKTLAELPKSMTVIVVSHRPSTIAFCDDAVVLEGGRVVETGPLSSVFSYRAMQSGVTGVR